MAAGIERSISTREIKGCEIEGITVGFAVGDVLHSNGEQQRSIHILFSLRDAGVVLCDKKEPRLNETGLSRLASSQGPPSLEWALALQWGIEFRPLCLCLSLTTSN